MTSIIWVGKPRTTKTLNMVIHGYSNHLKGYETATNFKCDFADKRIKDIYDVLDIIFSDVDRNPKQILLQEVDKWADSWLRSVEQRLLSSFAGQSGKRNLDILADTQFFERVQKSLRRVFEYGVTCSAYYANDRRKTLLASEVTLCEIGAFEEFIPLMNRPIILPVNFKINGKKISDYYEMYDSYEASKPFIAEDIDGRDNE